MALRFPKQLYKPAFGNAISGNIFVDNSISYLVDISNSSYDPIVAPSRYSEVRKVAFWINLSNIQSVDLLFRLRMFVKETLPGSGLTKIRTMVPSGFIIAGGTDPFGGFNPQSSNVEASLFPRRGDLVTLSQQGSGNAGAGVAFIEFERFNPLDQSFFDVWDSTQGEDDYIEFGFTLEFEVTPPFLGNNVLFFGFGMNTTQAPSPSNNTVTHVLMKHGREPIGTGQIAFDGDQTVQIRGLHRFRYNADEWDGISSVHLLVIGVSGSLQYAFRFCRIDSDNPPSTTTLLTESPSQVGQAFVYRTADLFSLMADGNDYTFDYHRTGSNIGDVLPILEIIQKNATKTKTYFESSAPSTWTLFGPGSNNDQTTNQQGLIDPLWFEDYPDSRFTARTIFGALLHRNAGNNPQMELLIDADLTSDISPSGGPTTFRISPSLDDIGSVGEKWEYFEKPIETPDPITLAGKRRLIQFKDGSPGLGHIWNITNFDDHWGTIGLFYAFTIPNTDTAELGPLFQLGAFDPEGCAATAAGLGDPGLLVITNGKGIPQKFNPEAGVIEDAGIPVPFSGEVPSTSSVDAGASPLNGLTPGMYVYRYTFRNPCTKKESDPNLDDILVDTTANAPAANVTLSFAGVRIPADSQITEICLYRTLQGAAFPIMAKVGCFNVSTATLFVDTVADAALDFTNKGLSLLNGPMPCVPIIAEFRNRLFGMGDIPNLSPAGTVTVTNGLDIVVGSNLVVWDRCLEGKFIQVQGDCRPYEIDKVLPPSEGISPPVGRLKLVELYEGVNGTGLNYTLCGKPNRLYISEPLEPECWPAANFLDIEPGDGDRLMGAESNFNRLIICKRRKTYIMTFQLQPATEVVVPLRISSDIGCIAPRSFAQIASGTAWLSDRGLALYDGRTVQHVPVSNMMNNIFIDPDDPNYVRRDSNGRVIEAIGVFYPKREQYLLLLPTVKTKRGASMMLVWDVSLNNITLLEFCQEFLSMTVAKDTNGNERVYLGDANGFVWIYDIGCNDGAGFPNQTGTVRGLVTGAGSDASSGASFLDDSSASFIVGGLPSLGGLSGIAGLSGAFGGSSPSDSSQLGLAGACIFTRRAGAGLGTPWVQRFIFASNSTRIFVTPGWGVDLPVVGDDYMIAPIELDLIFKPTNYGTDDMPKRDWRQIITYDPQLVSSKLRIELRPDFSTADPEELTVTDDQGVTGGGRIADLGSSKGRILLPVGRNIHNFMSPRFRNFAPDEPVRILDHALRKTPKVSR